MPHIEKVAGQDYRPKKCKMKRHDYVDEGTEELRHEIEELKKRETLNIQEKKLLRESLERLRDSYVKERKIQEEQRAINDEVEVVLDSELIKQQKRNAELMKRISVLNEVIMDSETRMEQLREEIEREKAKKVIIKQVIPDEKEKQIDEQVERTIKKVKGEKKEVPMSLKTPKVPKRDAKQTVMKSKNGSKVSKV